MSFSIGDKVCLNYDEASKHIEDGKMIGIITGHHDPYLLIDFYKDDHSISMGTPSRVGICYKPKHLLHYNKFNEISSINFLVEQLDQLEIKLSK